MSMGFRTSVTIDRPIDQVWAAVTDFERASEWMPGIEKVTRLDSDRLAEGAKFEIEMTTSGRQKGTREMTLAEWNPDQKSFALSSTEGSVSALYRYNLGVDGKDRNQTQVSLNASCTSESFFMKLLHPFIVYMMKKHDSQQLVLLKEMLETM